MLNLPTESGILLRILDTPADMVAVEDLQRLVWPGNETDVVPSHLLVTAAHNGGLVIGAYQTSTPPAQAAFDEQALSGAPLVGFTLAYEYTWTNNGKSLAPVTNFLPAQAKEHDAHALLAGMTFGF